MPQPTAVPLDQVDLTDLDAFARNEGWAMFDTLRAEDPVHWTPEAPPNSRLLGGDQVRRTSMRWIVIRRPSRRRST